MFKDVWFEDVERGRSLFMTGIVGLVILGMSIAALFRIDKQREPSLWRLAEKVVVLLALAFMIVDLVISASRGTNEEMLHPVAWLLSIVADVLIVAVLLSYTERNKKRGKVLSHE